MVFDVLHAASPILHVLGEFEEDDSGMYPRFRPQPLIPDHFHNQMPWMDRTRLSRAMGSQIMSHNVQGVQFVLDLNTTHVPGPSSWMWKQNHAFFFALPKSLWVHQWKKGITFTRLSCMGDHSIVKTKTHKHGFHIKLWPANNRPRESTPKHTISTPVSNGVQSNTGIKLLYPLGRVSWPSA